MLKMPTRSWVIILLLLWHFSLIVQGKILWSTEVAGSEGIIKTAYPIGNGQLAGMRVSRVFALILNQYSTSIWRARC